MYKKKYVYIQMQNNGKGGSVRLLPGRVQGSYMTPTQTSCTITMENPQNDHTCCIKFNAPQKSNGNLVGGFNSSEKY